VGSEQREEAQQTAGSGGDHKQQMDEGKGVFSSSSTRGKGETTAAASTQ
jgi:hypothetical protein